MGFVTMAELSSLQRLLRQFVSGELSYQDFHGQFVRDFLSIHHRDQVIEDVVNLIESSCADLDENDISVARFKVGLTQTQLAKAVGAGVSTISELEKSSDANPGYKLVARIIRVFQRAGLAVVADDIFPLPDDAGDDQPALPGVLNERRVLVRERRSRERVAS